MLCAVIPRHTAHHPLQLRASDRLLGLFSLAAYYTRNLSDKLSVALVKKTRSGHDKSAMAGRDAAN
jgi:hypothetical protein